jgi:ATP-dependent Clp protease ATP-binding subunit ClpX
MDDVELVFEQGALEAIADKTLEKKTGARGLRSIMEQTLIPIMFKVPSEPTISKVIITADCVKNGTAPDVERDETRTERKLTTTLDFSVDHSKKKKKAH